jgi:DinB superfamily
MTHEELTVSVAIASWKNTVERADKVFSTLTDEQFLQEVAPGRNRIIYLLGHLTAVHDGLHPILGLGERLYPDFEAIFISKPDRAIKVLPSTPQLKKSWSRVNHSLFEKFARLSPENWLQRHMAMSDEDYAKDPTRNRLSVLLSRTNHLAYHLGQIILAPG